MSSLVLKLYHFVSNVALMLYITGITINSILSFCLFSGKFVITAVGLVFSTSLLFSLFSYLFPREDLSFASVFCGSLWYLSQKFSYHFKYIVKKAIFIYCIEPVGPNLTARSERIDSLTDTLKPLKSLIQLFIAPCNLFYTINVINIIFSKFSWNKNKPIQPK